MTRRRSITAPTWRPYRPILNPYYDAWTQRQRRRVGTIWFLLGVIAVAVFGLVARVVVP